MQVVHIVKGSLLLAALAALGGSAYGQASASDAADHYWSFDISPSSAGFNLGIQDLGLTTYNLVNSQPNAYTSFTGTGSASATVDPGSGYNGSSGGFNGADGSAMNSVGSSVVSVGSAETLAFTNLGGDGIYLDITTSPAFSPVVSAIGNSYASVESIVGLSYSGTNQFIDYKDDTIHGITYNDPGGYFDEGNFGGQEQFNTYDEIVIGDGQTVDVTFYAGTIETAAVPTPPGGLTLVAGLGVFGLLRRRRTHATK